jgi:hypothetical protein
MSAQFFKIFAGVLAAHLAGLSIIWVGFSAPAPRPPAVFMYQGELPLESAGSPAGELAQKGKMPDQFVLDHQDASYSNQWTRLREPSKTSTYDHLGF